MATTITIIYCSIAPKSPMYRSNPGMNVIPIPGAARLNKYVKNPPTAPPTIPDPKMRNERKFTTNSSGYVIPNKVGTAAEIMFVRFTLSLSSSAVPIAAPNCPAILAVPNGFNMFNPVSLIKLNSIILNE